MIMIGCLLPDLWQFRPPRCESALPSSHLELLTCPACPDSFLLPSSFFQVLAICLWRNRLWLIFMPQHINRASLQLSLECPPCKKVICFEIGSKAEKRKRWKNEKRQASRSDIIFFDIHSKQRWSRSRISAPLESTSWGELDSPVAETRIQMDDIFLYGQRHWLSFQRQLLI